MVFIIVIIAVIAFAICICRRPTILNGLDTPVRVERLRHTGENRYREWDTPTTQQAQIQQTQPLQSRQQQLRPMQVEVQQQQRPILNTNAAQRRFNNIQDDKKVLNGLDTPVPVERLGDTLENWYREWLTPTWQQAQIQQTQPLQSRHQQLRPMQVEVQQQQRPILNTNAAQRRFNNIQDDKKILNGLDTRVRVERLGHTGENWYREWLTPTRQQAQMQPLQSWQQQLRPTQVEVQQHHRPVSNINTAKRRFKNIQDDKKVKKERLKATLLLMLRTCGTVEQQEKNELYPFTVIDLHNFALEEAMYTFQLFLAVAKHEYKDNKYSEEKRYVYVITGRGKHSQNGPVIKPNVKEYLREYGYTFDWKTDGKVRIDLISKKRPYITSSQILWQ